MASECLGFSAVAASSVDIEMDASDWGVCGVWHSHRRYFAIPWDEEEKALIASFKKQEDMTFSINYRELLGAYFLWYGGLKLGGLNMAPRPTSSFGLTIHPL